MTAPSSSTDELTPGLLRAVRRAAGLSQHAVGLQATCSRAAVSHYECARRAPTRAAGLRYVAVMRDARRPLRGAPAPPADDPVSPLLGDLAAVLPFTERNATRLLDEIDASLRLPVALAAQSTPGDLLRTQLWLADLQQRVDARVAAIFAGRSAELLGLEPLR